jgi:hypothetical protein
MQLTATDSNEHLREMSRLSIKDAAIVENKEFVKPPLIRMKGSKNIFSNVNLIFKI